jgi:hypothetical protein
MTRVRSVALRLGVAACLGTTGYLHAQLYLHGYRMIHVVGPAFRWQASASFAVGLLLLIANPPILRLVAAALCAGALGGFTLSRTVGLFGFVEHGWQPAPQALLSVLVELAALVLLAVATRSVSSAG